MYVLRSVFVYNKVIQLSLCCGSRNDYSGRLTMVLEDLLAMAVVTAATSSTRHENSRVQVICISVSLLVSHPLKRS